MGLPEGEYYFGEGKVHVVEGGRAYKAGTTTLAGAVVTLDERVRRFRAMTGASVVAALEAASLHPAQAIGVSGKKGALEVGADADLVLVDDALHVHATYIGGERVWSRGDAHATSPAAAQASIRAAVAGKANGTANGHGGTHPPPPLLDPGSGTRSDAARGAAPKAAGGQHPRKRKQR